MPTRCRGSADARLGPRYPTLCRAWKLKRTVLLGPSRRSEAARLLDAVYTLRCASIVKNGEGPGTFAAAGKRFVQFHRYAKEIGTRAPHPMEGRPMRFTAAAALADEVETAIAPERFWQVHDAAEFSRAVWRLPRFVAYVRLSNGPHPPAPGRTVQGMGRPDPAPWPRVLYVLYAP